ncbi:MAG: hypothetical protein IJ783_09190 [Kiritimatiellae bacterium]|nr:hypothetical protein [Kiritimatiellia bacterium]
MKPLLQPVILGAALCAATAAASPAPAAWRQADFAASLFGSAAGENLAVSGEAQNPAEFCAAAETPQENFAISSFAVAARFAPFAAETPPSHASRGVAFALQLGGAEPPAPEAAAATLRDAREALARASRPDAACVEGDAPGSFRFSAQWDLPAATITETPLCSALRIPCVGGTFEMLALAPSPTNSLAEIAACLSRPWLDRLDSLPRTAPEAPPSPRFFLRCAINLQSVLSPLGMAAFFENRPPETQEISIASDITGIEAVVGMEGPAAPEAADSPEALQPPFLFLVRETRTGLILFVGRVVKL